MKFGSGPSGVFRALRLLWCGLIFGAHVVGFSTELVTAERIDWLRTEIARHDELYYKRAAPEISDTDYDELKRELRDLEKQHPEFAQGESGVGDDRSGAFPTYRHREKMLSLNKAYSEAEVRAFVAKAISQTKGEALGFTVEPKYDGLAISVTYEHGKLVCAVTRGNGIEGDDVTANARTIAALPAELASASADGDASMPGYIELRGEVYLTHAEFERINREREKAGEAVFSHPRNLAAGTLKLSDSAAVAKRSLSIVFYGIGASSNDAGKHIGSQVALHETIRGWGVPGIDSWKTAKTADEVWRAIEAIGAERKRLAYPIDGVVVKVNSFVAHEQLGASDTAPNWAIAYKFPAQRVETRVHAITVQVGRTGVLTPVAELEPVRIAGSKVTRASLHNREEIVRKDVRVGDFVYVEKAGEIIPAVVGVNFARRASSAETYRFPDTCPACDHPVVSLEGEVAVRCPNFRCGAQMQRRIEHFVSKDAVNIVGLGPTMIEKLIASGAVRDVADLYTLTRDHLVNATGGEKSADRMLLAITQSKQAERWRVIHGLGIPGVGAVRSRDLAKKFSGLLALAEMSEFDLTARGVDRVAAKSLASYFARAENRDVVRRLAAVGVGAGGESVVPPKRVSVERRLAGKTVVFSGTLPTWTREEAAERVRAAGGVVRENVSKQTDFLVAGQGAGVKRKAAEDLGVQVIDEAELRRLLEAR